ncbi:response regulator [Shewanella sp. SG44-6]|jgi:predicted transcriptional regulator|uniref:response regulator n=1 Tax=unclassified Shewanella TaxID=196818 RepID=UPI0015FECEDD|nr:response regulator [Shewanella sp. SG44-6]MBB1391526.1 response regulator [Shewanella sp. SG44-6]
MPKASIKICSTLHTILQDESFNHFQVIELRDVYHAVSQGCESVSQTYNFIYRQISRLVKKGLLKKSQNEGLKSITYQKTELFSKTNFIISTSDEQSYHPLSQAENISKDKIQNLEQRLKQSEVDLLTSIGESEEYMRLYNSFPEMKSHLESQYMLARENSSKLLGQIKAIKSVLTHQQK